MDLCFQNPTVALYSKPFSTSTSIFIVPLFNMISLLKVGLLPQFVLLSNGILLFLDSLPKLNHISFGLLCAAHQS